MTISWKQTQWCDVEENHRIIKKAWGWSGTRADGRSFRIFFFPSRGYECVTFNGKFLGRADTLAKAQKFAESVPVVKLGPKIEGK